MAWLKTKASLTGRSVPRLLKKKHVQNSDELVRATQIALSSYRQIARSRGKHEGFELRGAEHGYFMGAVAFRKQKSLNA
jgi:hypothetical protein